MRPLPLILPLALAACTPPSPPTGGPCTYDEAPGHAAITAITSAPVDCDDHCAPCMTVRARLPGADGAVLMEDFVLRDGVSRAWLETAGWSVGAEVAGTVRHITTGTCTPVGFVRDTRDDDATAATALASCGPM